MDYRGDYITIVINELAGIEVEVVKNVLNTIDLTNSPKGGDKGRSAYLRRRVTGLAGRNLRRRVAGLPGSVS